jgi:hypothetical protein
VKCIELEEILEDQGWVHNVMKKRVLWNISDFQCFLNLKKCMVFVHVFIPYKKKSTWLWNGISIIAFHCS